MKCEEIKCKSKNGVVGCAVCTHIERIKKNFKEFMQCCYEFILFERSNFSFHVNWSVEFCAHTFPF